MYYNIVNYCKFGFNFFVDDFDDRWVDLISTLAAAATAAAAGAESFRTLEQNNNYAEMASSAEKPTRISWRDRVGRKLISSTRRHKYDKDFRGVATSSNAMLDPTHSLRGVAPAKTEH